MPELTENDEEVWESIRHETMDELAQEIGRMCLYWSELEMSITLFLVHLLEIEDPTSKNIVVGSLDLRSKLQALLPIAFARSKNDAWYGEVEAVVNFINNDIRPERNRIIHDSWIEMPGMDQPHRMRIQGKVVNTQSRTKTLVLADYRPFSAKDVGLLYVKMLRANERIRRISFEGRTLRASQVMPSQANPT